jgi:hypothetical protein
MTSKINYIAKELLAKLLAQENLSIEHRHVQTAMFDCKNRVLVLPIYKDITEDLYDLFIGHECGHAIYTPSNLSDYIKEKAKKFSKYPIFCNILEDARIEKLVKRKFPGLAKSFFYAYKELADIDTFGIKKRDVQELPLIDRINIYFKLGLIDSVSVSFTDEEKDIVREIEKAETFDQIIAICDKLAEKAQEDLQEAQDQEQEESDGDGEGQESKKQGKSKQSKERKSQSKSGDKQNADKKESKKNSQSEQDDESESKKNSQSEQDGEEGDSDDSSDGASGDDGDDDSEAEGNQPGQAQQGDEDGDDESEQKATQGQPGRAGKTLLEEMGSTYETEHQNYEKFIAERYEAKEVTYINLPDVDQIDLENYVVDYKELHSRINEFYVKENRATDRKYAELHLKEFRTKNTPVISYLAKEFEMRKKADEYARTGVAKSGIIDTNRLHSYQYNDDIFSKKEVIQDGKNHGLLMFIDCSGSMQYNYADTLEQTLNLVLFCRRTNIPFEVFGFTDYGYMFDSFKIKTKRDQMRQVNPRAGDVNIEDFCLKNYFSSRMNAIEFQNACINVQCIINSYRIDARRPGFESLSGTPLNSSIICAMKLVPAFRRKYNLQKVNTIFLTDGESNQISYTDEHGYGRNTLYSGAVLRNLKTRREYHIDPKYANWSATAALYDCFRDVTGSKVIGFYLDSSKENLMRLCSLDGRTNEYKNSENQTAYVLKKFFGYDELYAILKQDLKIIDQTATIESGNVSSRTVAKVFTEVLKNRIQNRVILTRFIEQIA